MKNQDNVHAGHRERMIQKLLSSSENFSDHELIEVLLYSVIPRKNTNEIAHALFRVFGGLEKIFNASAKELMTVEGIGERAASHIIMFGQLLKRVNIKKKSTYKCNNFAEVKKVFIEYFSDINYEKLVVALFDNGYRFINLISFTEGDLAKVSVDMKEVANSFAINKAVYTIIGHNHPSGDPTPSPDDIYTTRRIIDALKIFNIIVHDHIIIGGNRYISFSTLNLLNE
jgi:DNA repair protein RadC